MASVAPLIGIVLLVAALVASAKPSRAAPRRVPPTPPPGPKPPGPEPIADPGQAKKDLDKIAESGNPDAIKEAADAAREAGHEEIAEKLEAKLPPEERGKEAEEPAAPQQVMPATDPEPPPAAPPAATISLLRKGSQGRDVRELQARLKTLGFDPGSVDGIFGARTEAAVKAFQKSRRLTVDGIVGPKTSAAILAAMQAMAAPPPATAYMKLGARGPAVKDLQTRLNALGYNPGPADGIFGARTDAAVRAFQKAKGLKVDGIVGPATQAALAAAKPPATQIVVGPAQIIKPPPKEPPASAQPPPVVAVLKRGSTGRDVRELQARLNLIKFSVGKVDGIFGARTEAAVKAFQKSRRLTVDGIVGAKTQAAILAAVRALKPPIAAAPQPTVPTSTPPAPAPKPAATYLRLGARGKAVSELQTRLNVLGYNPGKVDGIFGAKTDAAVKAFQTAHALKPDGIVGPATTQALLNAKPPKTPPVVVPPTGTVLKPMSAPAPAPVPPAIPATVRRGSRGPDVVNLQRRLNAIGYTAGTADGIFGAKTETAVKAFQKAKGLKVDGIVGPATWTRLIAHMPGTAGLAPQETIAIHLRRIVASGNTQAMREAASVAREEGDERTARQLEARAQGAEIMAPGKTFTSPFPSVRDSQWDQFVQVMRGPNPAEVTPANQLGMFRVALPRLAQLGIVTNVRPGYKTVAGKRRKVPIADFRPPLTLEKFLSDPKLQYEVFTKDVHQLAAAIGARFPAILHKTRINGRTVTMSGLVAVAQMCGLDGLEKWLQMSPGEREKYATTMQKFNAANGLF